MEQREHHINPCCFCEDLAEWLGKRLPAALPTMAFDVYQEDFGWVVDLWPQGEKHVILVVAQTFLLPNEDERSDEFGIYVWNRKHGFWRSLFSKTPANLTEHRDLVVQAVDSALHAEAGIRQIAWWREGFSVGESTPHPII